MSRHGDEAFFNRIREVLAMGWVEIPQNPGYGGAGGPSKVLGDLVDARSGNLDIPNAGKWEIKYHSRAALLTLFHKDPEPKGVMDRMVHRFGRPDANGRTSFRHTIHKRSTERTGHHFYVANEAGRITVRDDAVADFVWPYWTHDTLVNAFASKFRRLILVAGSKRNSEAEVRFNEAIAYEEPKTTRFIDAIVEGVIAIDFDARTRNGSGLRNHGTKFRINAGDLDKIYQQREVL